MVGAARLVPLTADHATIVNPIVDPGAGGFAEREWVATLSRVVRSAYPDPAMGGRAISWQRRASPSIRPIIANRRPNPTRPLGEQPIIHLVNMLGRSGCQGKEKPSLLLGNPDVDC